MMDKPVRWQISVAKLIDEEVKDVLKEMGGMSLREYVNDLVKEDLKKRGKGLYAKKSKN
jgi:hypothetical protein